MIHGGFNCLLLRDDECHQGAGRLRYAVYVVTGRAELLAKRPDFGNKNVAVEDIARSSSFQPFFLVGVCWAETQFIVVGTQFLFERCDPRLIDRGRMCGFRKKTVVVDCVGRQGDTNLAHIICTMHLLGPCETGTDRPQSQRGEGHDDGHYDQHLHHSEASCPHNFLTISAGLCEGGPAL